MLDSGRWILQTGHLQSLEEAIGLSHQVQGNFADREELTANLSKLMEPLNVRKKKKTLLENSYHHAC